MEASAKSHSVARRVPIVNDVPVGSQLLTVEEVAARLGVPRSWVAKAARADRIPHVPIGRYQRFRWADIEVWLERQKRGS
jgi:excisionase family DNA binding protein